MIRSVYLFVDQVTPEIISDAQQKGISCVYSGIPPEFQSQAEREGWVLPHTMIIEIIEQQFTDDPSQEVENVI